MNRREEGIRLVEAILASPSTLARIDEIVDRESRHDPRITKDKAIDRRITLVVRYARILADEIGIKFAEPRAADEAAGGNRPRIKITCNVCDLRFSPGATDVNGSGVIMCPSCSAKLT